jgi:CcmD family protein
MSTALGYVAAVNIVIWAGIFGYLIYLDRRVRAAESTRPDGENKP